MLHRMAKEASERWIRQLQPQPVLLVVRRRLWELRELAAQQVHDHNALDAPQARENPADTARPGEWVKRRGVLLLRRARTRHGQQSRRTSSRRRRPRRRLRAHKQHSKTTANPTETWTIHLEKHQQPIRRVDLWVSLVF